MNVAYWQTPEHELLAAHDDGDHSHESQVVREICVRLGALLDLNLTEEPDDPSFMRAFDKAFPGQLLPDAVRKLLGGEGSNELLEAASFLHKGSDGGYDWRTFAVKHWNWMYLDGEYGNLQVGMREWNADSIRRLIRLVEDVQFDYGEIPEDAADSDIRFSIRVSTNAKIIYATLDDLKAGRVTLSAMPMRASTKE